jgi:hypothetical protein
MAGTKQRSSKITLRDGTIREENNNISMNSDEDLKKSKHKLYDNQAEHLYSLAVGRMQSTNIIFIHLSSVNEFHAQLRVLLMVIFRLVWSDSIVINIFFQIATLN